MINIKIIPCVLLVFYITYWTTWAYSTVGDVLESSIVPWHLPISICVLVCVPAVLGYLIGLEDGLE